VTDVETGCLAVENGVCQPQRVPLLFRVCRTRPHRRNALAYVLAGALIAGCSSSGGDDSADDGAGGDTGGAAPDADLPSGELTGPDGWEECWETARDVEVADRDGAGGEPVDGETGVGDPYFPELGNTGYDSIHYLLDLTWDPETNHLDGVMTLDAVAVQDLASFGLDLVDLAVDEVTVDGEPADFERRDERGLVISPAAPLPADDPFQVQVRYQGEPTTLSGQFPGLGGWQPSRGEVFVAAEPDGAATFYPVNDHPSDKACYSFRITAPDDLVAVTNGLELGRGPGPGEGTLTWQSRSLDPMASYLVQVAVANFVIEEDESGSGVPVRHAIDEDVRREGSRAMAPTVEMLDFYEEIFGPYPFEVYGGLVVDDPIGFALETQTLSLFPAHTSESTVAHELVHQWFGNWVSPADWQDIWLNEGFASYGEWLWVADQRGMPVEDVARAAGRNSPELDQPPVDPGADRLFHPTVYIRGGMTLVALQHTIGDDAFDEFLREWLDRFGGGTATTGELEALAAEVSGQDLADLFDVWLRSDELPDLDAWVN
jgi:aminopeptidase N